MGTDLNSSIELPDELMEFKSEKVPSLPADEKSQLFPVPNVSFVP